MNWDKIINDFINNYMMQAPYADRDELFLIVNQMRELINNNKDKSIEEIIDLILSDNIRELEEVRRKYGIPGYTIGMKVGNINIKIFSGTLHSLGEKMTDDALFDIASMTKFYTQVICYHLMNEGYFAYNDRIIDLDDRFKNLNDLTIEDILTFGTTFQIDDRVDNKKSMEEAKNVLFNTKVIATNKYNYNDIGMMIIKEVIERVTGMSYEELFQKYIIKPYNLSNTHLIVPKNKIKLVTGTPNFKIGHVNDAKANILGGFSGHAGVFATSDDIIKFMMASHNRVPNISDAYTPGNLNDAIARMGNAYVSHPTGLVKSFVDTLEPRDTIAIQGSTRVNANASSTVAHDVLFNPSSMSIEEARMRVEKINEERLKAGKSLISPISEYDVNGEHYRKFDSRQLIPVSESEKAIKRNAIAIVKLRFFIDVILAYEKNCNEINYVRNTNKH